MMVIYWSGVVIGLVIVIILILRKVNFVYVFFGGVIVGGLVGGVGLV